VLNLKPFPPLLGWHPTGDVGPYTIYTSSRGAVVTFPRSPALQPASFLQKLQRAKWSTAILLWQQMPSPDQATWSQVAKRASLRFTGYALWISANTRKINEHLATLEHQTGATLPRKPSTT
jgi:hypothetical protein